MGRSLSDDIDDKTSEVAPEKVPEKQPDSDSDSNLDEEEFIVEKNSQNANNQKRQSSIFAQMERFFR